MDGTFEILGPVRDIEVIATGRGVRVRRMLKRKYGGENWRKLKGIALIRDRKGRIREAEVHWYECHGIGRRLVKIKR